MRAISRVSQIALLVTVFGVAVLSAPMGRFGLVSPAMAQMLREDGTTIRWGNEFTDVVVEKGEGLVAVIDKKTGQNLLGSGPSHIYVTLDPSREKQLVAGPRKWEVDSETLVLRSEVADVVVEELLTLRPSVDRAWVEREVRLYSDTSHIVRGVHFGVNIAGLGPPRWHHNNMVVHGPLAVAYWGSVDYGRHQPGGSSEFSHESRVIAKLGPEYEPVVVGTQYLFATEGKGPEAIHDFYRITRFAPPVDTPDWLRGSVMYSGHPGGRIESLFADVGGFDALKAQLPHLHDLGVDIIWLLPIFQFNEPPNRSFEIPYGVYDYFQIEEVLGGEEAARAYIDEAHHLGMKVIIDMVPHGGFTPLFHDHPEWLTYDEDLRPHAIFGWGADYSQPGWQKVQRDVARLWAERLDIDGFRIDLGAPDEPSWDLDRPSASTLGGGIGMVRAMRDGFRAVKERPLIYSEMLSGPGTGEIEHSAYVDVNYGWSFFNRITELWGGNAPLRGWPSALKRLLHDEYLAFAPGYLFARFITNHDMTRDYGRPIVRFGPGMANALMSIAAFIDGIPLIYQGQEIGVGETLKKIFETRKALPQLVHGVPLYQATKASPGVFSFARLSEEGYAVPIVNLNAHPLEAEIDVSDLPLSENVWAHDVMTDSWHPLVDGQIHLPLEAFGAAVLLFPEEAEVPSQTADEDKTGETRDERVALPFQWSDGEIVSLRMRITLSEWGWPAQVTVGDDALFMDSPTLAIGESLLDTVNALPLFPPLNRPVRITSPAEIVRGKDWVGEGTSMRVRSQAIWSDRRQEVPLDIEVEYTPVGEGLKVDVVITLQGELELRNGMIELYWGIPATKTWALNTAYGLYHDALRQLSPNWLGSRAYGWESDHVWRRRYVPYRLWSSVVHPLHEEAPFMAFMNGERSLTLLVAQESADLYLSDGTDLRKPHPFLHVTWLDPLRPQASESSEETEQPALESTMFPAGHSFAFSLTLVPSERGFEEIKEWAGGPFTYRLPQVRR